MKSSRPAKGGDGARSDEAQALVFREVSKSFAMPKRRLEALKSISFQIPRGRVTGLIGPDGAGKTTLMRLAACLLKPDHGDITVLEIDALAAPLAVQAAVGYMPQRFGLYEDLTVQENLDLYSDLQGVPPAKRSERFAELMQMTALGEFTARLAGRLSGGMKQKLGLACTLLRFPRLLLLDEPTVGVDPVSRRELWAIVDRMVESEGMTVLLSTAYLDEAERCDSVLVLHEGRILAEGPPDRFRERQKGRTYRVTAPAVKKRRLQERLAAGPGVLDAVIQGEAVRLVFETAERPDPQTLLPRVEEAEIESVPPRFEDTYVVMLRSETRQEEIQADSLSELRTERPEKEAPVIRVEGVKRRFGDFYAVKGISFEAYPGEVFGLLGANGAGKTTTFRMLCGLLPASEGRLRVAGRDLRKAAAKARARIGYMSQKFSLYANLSVLQNLQFFSSTYGLSGSRRRKQIDWVMELFELRAIADAVSGDLPLGFKQRLALAAALMHRPDILFLDEPTSGVDPIARRAFWRQINALAEAGVTVLVTTHFMEEAEYCDRLAIMAAGEILALGTPLEIKQRAGRAAGRAARTMEEAFIALIESERTEAA